MKRYLLTAVTIAVGMMIVGNASAQMDKIAKLDIKAIKKMQFVEKGKDLVAQNVLVFSNAGDSDVKLRNAEFKVSLKSADKVVPMGVGKLAELVLPAAKKGEGDALTPSELVQEMEIKVGPKDDETIQKLITMFNIIGDPGTTFTLVLEGTSEVGAKSEKGWIYQKGITVELEFQPSIQREVLFK
jgi:hypothetical protein